ncbi:hypothetical protein [Pseudohoeflea coraliihabitans]|uniref:Uncharacterized protein n=1 Tax=Pseudohoeflea coraliihabitans TaxID=2860393 RepID=A0ABS6WMA1_9HYPH|nr:hypothetical protein [Pseudohoeflea sp. DP4N28-3]MBW3096240.1 hypothetical protein [Pseudohoeflea sp. DP4N28-3]
MPIAYPIAPFDASLSRRIAWLETQVINPSEKLLAALAPDKRPYFSDWPEEFANKARVNFEGAASELECLLENASELRASLITQRDQGISHLSEMRYDIVFNLVEILRQHFPELKLSRGQFDRQLGITIGVIPDFIRAAYLEITGTSEQLDAPIQTTLDAVRKNQRKSR